jgi:choline-sulfatase
VLRVPMMLWVPGVAPRAIESLVSLIDVAPTLLDLLGLAPLPDTQGISLAPLLRGEPIDERPLLAQDCPPTGEVHSALLLGRFKYLRRMRRTSDEPIERDAFVGMPPVEQELASEHLYDLIDDPRELVDLALDPAHAATLERARAALDHILAGTQAAAQRFQARRAQMLETGTDLDEELRQLGY